MSHDNSNTSANVAILTVSDTRSLDTDVSGMVALDLLQDKGHLVMGRLTSSDNIEEIRDAITSWLEDSTIDAILVTGGTGIGIRDVTIEAVKPLCSITLQGFGELFRQLSYEEVGAKCMLSRADAGIIVHGNRRIPVFIVPGSPKAVKVAVEKIVAIELGHILDLCRGEVSS